MRAKVNLSRMAALAVVCAGVSTGVRADDAPPHSERVAAALQPYIDRHAVAGAVALVANRDGIVSLDTVGSANIADGKPMTPDIVFWIASQSKPITATALMMLVDEGKVKLDEPVSTYLPEFKDVWVAAERDDDHILLRRPARPILVCDLLRHTSGLPFVSPLEHPTLDALPLRVGVLSYAMTPLNYEPGAGYRYSNAGINTAGRIIEVVSGMPYEQFLQQRLFDPLGMKDTTFWPSGAQLDRIATSYKPDSSKQGLEPTTIGQLTYPLDDRSRQPMPAGGLFSTAADLARFCRMILNDGTLDGHRYLSESSVREMTKRQTPPALNESYGFGWSIGGDTFFHGGAYATNMTIDPSRGLVLIYMVQHAGFPRDGGEARGAFERAARDDATSKK